MTNRDYYFIKPYDENLTMPPKESFSQILSEVYLHPFTWNARTTRKSYWWSVLINAILSILCMIILSYAFNSNINLGLKWIDGVIVGVILIWLFLANLGQAIRRLHDVNYSGYWYWLCLVPTGQFFLFYLSLQPSLQRPVKWNQYLFTVDQNSSSAYYNQPYEEENDLDDTPVPTISQILKEHFFDCFKWDARSTRTSFWVGTAINSVASVILVIFLYIFGFILFLIPSPNEELHGLFPFLIILGIIFIAALVWLFLAQLGHTVRRLHDANFIGWWYWISLVPYVGDLLLAFFLFHPTVKKDVKWNRYLFKPKDRIR
ncbi:DUF805 domain-containing protein [Lactobacillus hamsteri]|uniref:DUF805 domain-containing protein n=1 Tax=Lactobacillus hamsteri DSM 5661 = JCM 6256 TaxID=1423754 RepID=A0A0R1YIA8_9LACO|nr:DUF805 domain-containing protein [Lactobacillus hamsteri]KRM40644.1 hypothetical protein FC39_GL000246 [Lactobacillus hamsteri DSM 5661 = JCM 6256]